MQLQKFLLFLLTVALIAICDVESGKDDWHMMFSHNINLKPKQYHISKDDSTDKIETSTTIAKNNVENDSKSVISSSKTHLRIVEHYPIGKKSNANLTHVIIESLYLNIHDLGCGTSILSTYKNLDRCLSKSDQV